MPTFLRGAEGLRSWVGLLLLHTLRRRLLTCKCWNPPLTQGTSCYWVVFTVLKECRHLVTCLEASRKPLQNFSKQSAPSILPTQTREAIAAEEPLWGLEEKAVPGNGPSIRPFSHRALRRAWSQGGLAERVWRGVCGRDARWSGEGLSEAWQDRGGISHFSQWGLFATPVQHHDITLLQLQETQWVPAAAIPCDPKQTAARPQS